MNILNIKSDIILFKDETLKTLRQIESQLLEKIKLKDLETESKISEFNSKLDKFQEINKRMYESILEQQVNLEKLKHLNEFKTKTDSKMISIDAKLNNYFSDLISIRTRYDKLLEENLTVPGVIGYSCKYRKISDYIKYNVSIIDQINKENDLMKKQLNELKEKNDLIEKNINISIDESISTCKLYADTRVNEVKIYFQDKFNELNRIVNSAKDEIEENIIKNEKINNETKNEIKNTKIEITDILEEKNKEFEEIRKEIKNIKNIEIINDLNQLQKKFEELKENLEKERNNSSNIIKKNENADTNTINNKMSNNNTMNNNNAMNNNNIMNDNNTMGNNNIMSNNNTISNNNENSIKINTKANNIFKEIKKKKNLGEKEHIKINAYKQTNKKYNANNKEIFNIKNNINYNFVKNKNDENNKEIEINKKNIKEKIKLKIEEKEIKLRENHNIINSEKEFKNNNEIDELNQLLQNKISKNEDDILITDKSTKNKDAIIINNDKMSRNKIFSKIKYDKFDKNNLTLDNKTVKNISIENSKNLYKTIKNSFIQTEKENISLEKENTISNLKRRFLTDNIFMNNIKNYQSEKNINIAIKLIKNKKQHILNNDTLYLKQRYPTLKLYKEFYEKKLKEEKENKKLNKINFPKRLSPAFGRTAYSKFIKENDDINLKKYNPNLNTIFLRNDIKNYINMNKLYTINGAIKSFKSAKLNKIKREIDDDTNKSNLSV